MLTRFFDRLSRNDQMCKIGHKSLEADTAAARRVYRDIYYI